MVVRLSCRALTPAASHGEAESACWQSARWRSFDRPRARRLIAYYESKDLIRCLCFAATSGSVLGVTTRANFRDRPAVAHARHGFVFRDSLRRIFCLDAFARSVAKRR